MLFEKLEYFLNKKLRDINKDMDEAQLNELETAKFRPLISKIKELYKTFNLAYKEQADNFLSAEMRTHGGYEEFKLESFISQGTKDPEHTNTNDSGSKGDETPKSADKRGPDSGFG